MRQPRCLRRGLILLACAAGAACGAPLEGLDPLLQAQFAQPRCWHSAASAAAWARRGIASVTESAAWRATPATAGPRWQVRPDRCVIDRATGLVWAPADLQEQLTADEATTYAHRANARQLCGHANWRLPERRELQGLVDYESAEHDTLPGLPGLANGSQSVWTARETELRSVSTSGVASQSRLTVNLPSGRVFATETTARRAALAVRDGTCQALGRGYWW
ncbi:DUF1566 domain-containing protein [Roseateles sp. BYS87W]|uniref:DUF1566 domain-containing protein n=1 Tax=Pelomonas baiyunensis TaxID=3299026 RepID=A0ABW7GVL1_9BURK